MQIVGTLAKTLSRSFQGSNVLVVAQLKNILPLISQTGINLPFDALNDDDFDLLFTITIDGDNKKDIVVSYYGKSHHVSDIPQRYLIQKFYPLYIGSH